MSSGLFLAVRPGGVSVVEGVVSEAAVEEADEALGEGAEGSLVGVSVLASLVVEGAGFWAGGDGGEGPLLAGVGETVVPGVAGEDDVAAAGGFGNGRRAGVVLARLGVGIAVGVNRPGFDGGSGLRNLLD